MTGAALLSAAVDDGDFKERNFYFVWRRFAKNHCNKMTTFVEDYCRYATDKSRKNVEYYAYCPETHQGV